MFQSLWPQFETIEELVCLCFMLFLFFVYVLKIAEIGGKFVLVVVDPILSDHA